MGLIIKFSSSWLWGRRLRNASKPTFPTRFPPSNISTMSEACSTMSAATTRSVPFQPAGSVPEYGKIADGSVSFHHQHQMMGKSPCGHVGAAECYELCRGIDETLRGGKGPEPFVDQEVQSLRDQRFERRLCIVDRRCFKLVNPEAAVTAIDLAFKKLPLSAVIEASVDKGIDRAAVNRLRKSI